MNIDVLNHYRTTFGRLAILSASVGLAVACSKKPAPTAQPAEQAPEPTEEVAKAPERDYPEPPAPSQPKPVNFPELQEFQTDNGLKVYVVENHEVPLVSAYLGIRAGTMDDEQVAEFTAAMLGEGTKKRSKAKIDEAIEFVGGSLSSHAGVHTTTIVARTLEKDLGLALELMADEALNPAFPKDALEKLKKQAKTALDAAKADPATLASTLFGMVAYPSGHPYGRPFPEPADIDKVTVENLASFHGTFYRANNAYLILAGDVTQQEAKPLVEKHFGKWAHVDPKELPENPLNEFKSYPLPEKLVIHLVDRPASAQSEIVVGNLALARNHPDWIPLEVTNAILGDGANGRLFMDLREEKGLTYGAYSNVGAGQAPGAFHVWTATKTKTTGEMVSAIFTHIEKMRSQEPGEEEFELTRAKLVGAFPLEIETPQQIGAKVNTILEYRLPNDYYKTYRDKVLAVGPADVLATAKKYIHPIPHVVIVGKGKKIEKQLAEALPDAEIKVYDTNLKPLAGSQ